MEYLSIMLCSGYSHEPKPCKYIMNCDLCTGPFIDTNGNERYVCGPGVADFRCKRDNPHWKPLTRQQFIELYNKVTAGKGTNVERALEGAIFDGVVEDREDE